MGDGSTNRHPKASAWRVWTNLGSSDGNHSIGSSPDGAAPTDMRISVRRSCLGSLANIITLWHRPSHKDTRVEEQKCLLFYQRGETILSSITSIFMAVVNLGIKAFQPKPIGWSDWTALGFVLVCLLTSQLYTQLCHCSLLFNLNPVYYTVVQLAALLQCTPMYCNVLQ